jgi:hypothetical protein
VTSLVVAPPHAAVAPQMPARQQTQRFSPDHLTESVRLWYRYLANAIAALAALRMTVAPGLSGSAAKAFSTPCSCHVSSRRAGFLTERAAEARQDLSCVGTYSQQQ